MLAFLKLKQVGNSVANKFQIHIMELNKDIFIDNFERRKNIAKIYLKQIEIFTLYDSMLC